MTSKKFTTFYCLSYNLLSLFRPQSVFASNSANCFKVLTFFENAFPWYSNFSIYFPEVSCFAFQHSSSFLAIWFPSTAFSPLMLFVVTSPILVTEISPDMSTIFELNRLLSHRQSSLHQEFGLHWPHCLQLRSQGNFPFCSWSWWCWRYINILQSIIYKNLFAKFNLKLELLILDSFTLLIQ